MAFLTKINEGNITNLAFLFQNNTSIIVFRHVHNFYDKITHLQYLFLISYLSIYLFILFKTVYETVFLA